MIVWLASTPSTVPGISNKGQVVLETKIRGENLVTLNKIVDLRVFCNQEVVGRSKEWEETKFKANQY